MQDINIRPIQLNDNQDLAGIIRQTLAEFGANRPGTVYFDPTTDHLFELFSAEPRSRYFVAEKEGRLLGGAGIYPTDALPESTCELVKMYLLPEARNIGLGRHMIDHCISTARELGFIQIYLETMPELKKAVSVYEKFGFTSLSAPMGNSGHTGCGIWMLKKI